MKGVLGGAPPTGGMGTDGIGGTGNAAGGGGPGGPPGGGGGRFESGGGGARLDIIKEPTESRYECQLWKDLAFCTLLLWHTDLIFQFGFFDDETGE